MAQTQACEEHIDEVVLVRLVQGLAAQAQPIFKTKLMNALGDGAAVADFEPDSWETAAARQPLLRQPPSLAPP